MEFTESEIRKQVLEQELREAMREFELRKQQYNQAKSRGDVPQDELHELAMQVDLAVNAAWDITQQMGSRAH